MILGTYYIVMNCLKVILWLVLISLFLWRVEVFQPPFDYLTHYEKSRIGESSLMAPGNPEKIYPPLRKRQSVRPYGQFLEPDRSASFHQNHWPPERPNWDLILNRIWIKE